MARGDGGPRFGDEVLIVIEVLKVSKSFNTSRANSFTAVSGVTCRVARNQVTVLKGPSGSGKTTLLTLIGCMARPSSGRIVLHGIAADCILGLSGDSLEVTSLPERFLAGIRRRSFGFIFQQYNLVRGISVLENVMLPTYPAGEGRTKVRLRAMELLDQFGIARHAPSRVETLSGGEMQRVATARSLINDPQIIIADEPTAHLDSRLSVEFMDMVGTLKAKGRTVLIASHDPLVFDSPIVDRVIEMRDGAITRGEVEA